jgi:integrase
VDVKEMEGSDFILPIITNKKDYQVQVEQARQGYRYLNKNMKKIAKLCNIDLPITSYYARYSWANIARAKGYSKDLIAEGLGHEYGNKVTGIYLDQYPDSIIDECNADVIGL